MDALADVRGAGGLQPPLWAAKKILTGFSPAQNSRPAEAQSRRPHGLTESRPHAEQTHRCSAASGFSSRRRSIAPRRRPPRLLAGSRLACSRVAPPLAPRPLAASPPSRPLCSAHRPVAQRPATARTGTAAPGGRSQQRAAGSLQPARTGVGVAVVVVALVVSLCFIVSRLPVSRGRHSWVAAPSSLQVISSTTAS